MLDDTQTAPDSRPHVVIIGGGFGGLNAAKALRKAPVRVTVVDKRNFHLFQPLLYQVAMASLAPSDIAYPIREVLRDQTNTLVIMDEVTEIDPERQQVTMTGGLLEYDYLILAVGSETNWFGNDDWAPLAPGLKSIEEAMDIRDRVLSAFEAAEQEPQPDRRRALLTFVVVGGGPTGVELAGALAEIARQTMKNNFRTFNPASARIVLVESGPEILGGFPDKLRRKAREALEALGVEIMFDQRVTSIDAEGVTVGDDRIPARTVVWGAGVRGHQLGEYLPVERVAGNRIPVEPTLTLATHPTILVVGDLAAIDDGGGDYLPGVAQVAIQSGKLAARNVERSIAGEPLLAFRYRDKGTLATIGWNRAVAKIGPLQLSGFPAWVVWATIHIAFLIDFRSRFSVMWNWIWAYITRGRGARLMVGQRYPPADPETLPPGESRRPPAPTADE